MDGLGSSFWSDLLSLLAGAVAHGEDLQGKEQFQPVSYFGQVTHPQQHDCSHQELYAVSTTGMLEK